MNSRKLISFCMFFLALAVLSFAVSRYWLSPRHYGILFEHAGAYTLPFLLYLCSFSFAGIGFGFAAVAGGITAQQPRLLWRILFLLSVLCGVIYVLAFFNQVPALAWKNIQGILSLIMPLGTLATIEQLHSRPRP